MPLLFPKVYPILDASFIPTAGRVEFLNRLGGSLANAGIALLEYRNKSGSDAELLADARALRAAMPGVRLIMDDRVDLAVEVGFDGVHVDAGDVSPIEARRLIGTGIVGTSASSESELVAALNWPVDYVAFGPVFATTTKQTKVAPIGIDGVRRFRSTAIAAGRADAVLVAAAGITLETAAEVLQAGANCVAVARGIFGQSDPAGEFERWMKVLA